MKKLSLLYCFVFLILTFTSAQHQEYTRDTTPGIAQRLEQWQDLKFGLLMHWGPYSQWGIVESWSICPEDLSWATGGRKPGIADSYNDYVKAYEALQTTFNPTKFNPQKWASAAAAAGMRYMVFTTKHHDGFCMFNTGQTDYKITDSKTPFSKQPNANITLEIFNAFRRQNFWIGAYFSKPDWHSPYYWWPRFPPADRNANYSIKKHPEQWKKFVDFTHAQVNELMSDYGKLDILWLDGGWVRKTSNEEVMHYLSDTSEGSRWARNPQNQDIDMPLLVKLARQKQPGLIVVDRAVPGMYQNYLTPEQHIPATGLPYPWETCMTMANSWSYVPNDKYKSTDELIEKLVDIVSKGGNLLLNIGPSPHGEWDSVAYDRLQGIGQWMKINSSAIYATRKYHHFDDGNNIRYTQSKDEKTVYAFLFNEPGSFCEFTQLKFSKGIKATLLGSKAAVKLKPTANGLQVQFPKGAAKGLQYVWVIKFDLP